MGLHQLQTTVHVAKDKRNDFGGYNYRTAEGILAAIKAALPDGATIVVTDSLQELAGQIFVTSTATVTFADGASASATGHALHPLTKKGMDPSQITGSATSYARKYALSGLVALDDGSVDPDAAKEPYQKADPEPEPFNAPATRDRIKAAIGKAASAIALEQLWTHPKTCEAFDQLPPPMQAELTHAYTSRMAVVYQAPPEAAE